MAWQRVFPLTWLFLHVIVTPSATSDCVPGSTCKAPKCRCWDDPKAPGGIPAPDTPQMVLLSFEYAVNSANVKNYSSLFEGIVNPNKCPPTGTFFVQKNYTSAEAVYYLYCKGHELGVTSSSGAVPFSWSQSFQEVKQFLVEAEVPFSSIVGSRAPQLMVSDDELDGVVVNDLVYEASCVTSQYTKPDYLLWPYTYDFVDRTPQCVMGTAPRFVYPGVWQFILTEMELNSSLSCATPSACSPYFKTSEDTFDFFSKNFFKHYNNKRTPFNIFADPQWLSVEHQVEGTKKFLQYLRAGFNDTWIISHSKALAWMMDPVTSGNATKYSPWNC